MDLRPQIERFSRRFEELESVLSDSKTFENPQRAQELSREYARLKDLVGTGQAYLKAIAELRDNRALAASEPEGSELGMMAKEEVGRLEGEEKRLEREIHLGILPPDPADSRNTIVEIRAGTGGEEAALFAADLFRMYSRYADAQGWKVEVMDTSPSERGGFKEIVFSIQGQDVYKKIRYESGVHRVQRVPETEAQGRIHTSTASVAVLPEAEEVDVQLRPEDMEITVCRASGPGGQGVNTTDSAVQINHKPSGLIVRCADERSQIKNKAKALRVLRSRLLAHKQEQEEARMSAARKTQIGSGDRSEKIRTYNFPQNRVTDHRINVTIQNLPAILEGDLDELIAALMTNDLNERLAETTA